MMTFPRRVLAVLLVLLVTSAAGCLAPSPAGAPPATEGNVSAPEQAPAAEAVSVPEEAPAVEAVSALGITEMEALAIAEGPAREWRADAVIVAVTGDEEWGRDGEPWQDPVPGDGRLLGWSLTFWSNATKNRMDVAVSANGSHHLIPPPDAIDDIPWTNPPLHAWNISSTAAAAILAEDPRWAEGIANATGLIAYELTNEQGYPMWQVMLVSSSGNGTQERDPPLIRGRVSAETGESYVQVFAW